MAKKFKDYYDETAAELLAQKLDKAAAAVGSTVDAESFRRRVVQAVAEAGDPPFGRRQDLFAQALEAELPADYPTSIVLLEALLGPPLEQPEGMFTHGWWLWPVGRYVERNALRDTAVSLRFIHELTRCFTGEFAIRPILAAEPQPTLAVLENWAQEEDVHVRRLSSEGMRISLPWASPERGYAIIRSWEEDLATLPEDSTEARAPLPRKAR
mgnify:FL=1